MTTGTDGIALIKSFESCRLVAYWDTTRWSDGSKRWSIGWGTTEYPDTKKRVAEGDTCTQAQADAWFAQDLGAAEQAVAQGVGKSWVNQHQFDALVALEYNAHPSASSTIYRYIALRQMQWAANEFPRWDKLRVEGVLQTSVGLMKRRLAERALFLTPMEVKA